MNLSSFFPKFEPQEREWKGSNPAIGQSISQLFANIQGVEQAGLIVTCEHTLLLFQINIIFFPFFSFFLIFFQVYYIIYSI